MPKAFSSVKIDELRKVLVELYVRKNKYLFQIARSLKLSQSGIYGRLKLCKIPITPWIMKNKKYQLACLRGLIDTDGSVYLLKSGSVQISFTNFSVPLLEGVRNIFLNNGFHPSKISSHKVYLTRKEEVERYFREVIASNPKHLFRYMKFKGGSHSGNCIRL